MSLCHELREELSAYFDGELGQAETRRVEAHLADCPACRKELDALRATWSLLDHVPPAEPRSDGPDQVWDRIHGQRRQRILRIGGIAAIAATLLMAVGLLWKTPEGGTDGGEIETVAEGTGDETSPGGEGLADVPPDEATEPTNDVDTLLEELDLYEHYDFLVAAGSDLDSRWDPGYEATYQDGGEDFDG